MERHNVETGQRGQCFKGNARRAKEYGEDKNALRNIRARAGVLKRMDEELRRFATYQKEM